MKPVNHYKKCFCCGRKYQVNSKEISCSCGGFLYIIGAVYQEPMKGAKTVERKN